MVIFGLKVFCQEYVMRVPLLTALPLIYKCCHTNVRRAHIVLVLYILFILSNIVNSMYFIEMCVLLSIGPVPTLHEQGSSTETTDRPPGSKPEIRRIQDVVGSGAGKRSGWREWASSWGPIGTMTVTVLP